MLWKAHRETHRASLMLKLGLGAKKSTERCYLEVADTWHSASPTQSETRGKVQLFWASTSFQKVDIPRFYRMKLCYEHMRA